MKKLILLSILIIITSFNVFGQIPKQLDYQGVLKDASGNLLTGDYALTFKIYNEATGGTPLWTEVQVINVSNGLFSAHLGSTTPITTVPFDRIHFLGITIGTETELSPRTLLTPSPYSFMSMDIIDNTVVKSLNSLKDNVNLVAGSNITITPSGNDLTISAGGSGGIIGGSGTTNYFPLFTNANTLGNSNLFQDASGNIQTGLDGSGKRLVLSAIDNVADGGQINWHGTASYDDWYQDLAFNRMRFFTNSANTNTVEIFNSGNGKADLDVEGEIQRQPTGDANMVPIAYASVNFDGVIITTASTSNVTLESHIEGSGIYRFIIANENLNWYEIICIVSLRNTIGFVRWFAQSKLQIYTYNISGEEEDIDFSFVLYKK